MPRDSISSNPALHQNSLTLSQGSAPNLASTHGRAGEVPRTSLERRDSITSSVYITIESPNNVARHLLEDLARMTKAGTSPLPLLHMTAALGCAWMSIWALKHTQLAIHHVCAHLCCNPKLSHMIWM